MKSFFTAVAKQGKQLEKNSNLIREHIFNQEKH